LFKLFLLDLELADHLKHFNADDAGGMDHLQAPVDQELYSCLHIHGTTTYGYG
jgi:hypothetical protein